MPSRACLTVLRASCTCLIPVSYTHLYLARGIDGAIEGVVAKLAGIEAQEVVRLDIEVVAPVSYTHLSGTASCRTMRGSVPRAMRFISSMMTRTAVSDVYKRQVMEVIKERLQPIR